MFREIAVPLQPLRRNGGIGRHEGLKIPWPGMAVRVRVPLAAHYDADKTFDSFINRFLDVLHIMR